MSDLIEGCQIKCSQTTPSSGSKSPKLNDDFVAIEREEFMDANDKVLVGTFRRWKWWQ